MKTRLRHGWIWFWYSDWTRFLVVLVPTYLVVLIPVLQYLGLEGELLRRVVIGIYLTVVCWAMLDNDYTRLEEIGLTAYRKPLARQQDKPYAS